MHPTGAAALSAAQELEPHAIHSMDWLFKKERIYLLAQFWQQRATLAEKEVTNLKEQLAIAPCTGVGGPTAPRPPSSPPQPTRATPSPDSPRITIAEIPVPATSPPLDQQMTQSRNCPSVDQEMEEVIENRQTPLGDKQKLEKTPTNCNNNNSINSTKEPKNPIDLEMELASKEREISQLGEDVQRLKASLGALRESHSQQLRRLEQRLDDKRRHIARLEARLDTQRDYDEIKREVSILRSVDFSAVTDSKQFQQLLIERSKILAQSCETQQREREREQRELQREREIQQQQAQQLPLPQSTPPQQGTNSSHPDSDRESVERDRLSVDRRDSGSGVPEEIPSSPPSPRPPTINNNTTHLNHNHGSSPFRFDELRSPFRFADDPGPLPPGALVGRLGDSLIPKGDPMEARLQEMLRYNMDRYATQALDTLHISRRVRELLSVHNIGQRLFAKYVLGLSQGTVSELLSKPKPWDKLTEKGRDSYRKMHAWACDDGAVMLLKSLIPKKTGVGKEGMPPFGRESGDMNDERIAHILSEASQMMRTPAPNEDSRSNDDSKSPHAQCLSPFSNKESSQNRRLKKYENDDIPQEKVVRIYQEELAKLMGKRVEDMRQPREGFPGTPQMERPHDDNLRMALEAYHRELAKLQGQGPGLPPGLPPGLSPNLPPGFPGLLALQQHHLQQQQQQHHQQNPHVNGGAPTPAAGVQDLSLPKDKLVKENGVSESEKEKMMDAEEAIRHAGSAFSLVRPKLEPGMQSSTGSSASSPLGNSILPPAIPGEEFSGAAAASPLQRMASITNSLISQPANQPHHTSSQRPLKAVLPPITQQQFDLFNNLNTEDIVRRVKESLSQYSISQRLFGESVLGLSQGSVSDLLARPKPWHMLTQKGREPFIRMKMFLEDDNAVHKLVASQYKIAPEKLMRTGSYGGVPQCPANLSKPMQPTQKMINDANQLFSKLQQDQQAAIMGAGGPPPLLLTPPGYPPHAALQMRPELTQEHKMQNKQPPPPPPPIHHSPLPPHQSSVMRALHQHISPSVYEMAALTQDLDTQTITTKIKEALLANNIGQKIFGEAVLGLSQGSVSELLSKPKPWHMLSIKGREPFIRMQLWLSDAHNVDRLQALKNERREANKRRRSTGPGGQDNSSDTSSNDTAEFYHSTSPSPHAGGAPSAKKQRVLFSEEQKEALRLAFALDPYPNMATIEFLANELGLSTRTITNWFHNHRMRLKQQVPHSGGPGDIPPREQSGNQAPFDPVQFRLLLNQRLLELQKERLGLAGIPLPYPPYFAANPNLAALLGRGLIPPGDAEMALNAVKEQMNGLDLSMPLKREPDGDDFEDDDVESNMGSEDSMDERSFMEGDGDMDADGDKTDSLPRGPSVPGARSSRRKPAAPQWVNPEWQDDKERPPNPDEVIINGVCVMQTEDYGRRAAERTIRIEPSGAEGGEPAASPRIPPSSTPNPRSEPPTPSPAPHEEVIKTEVDADRWEY